MGIIIRTRKIVQECTLAGVVLRIRALRISKRRLSERIVASAADTIVTVVYINEEILFVINLPQIVIFHSYRTD